MPCRFQVLLDWRTDRRRNQTYRSTSPFNRNNKTYGELKTILEEERPDTYVGMPTALLSMLRMCGKGSIKRALISGDACPETVMKAIEKILGTPLWPHYGSREMGLGVRFAVRLMRACT